jgi:23S rRNA pseudouridine1911/1915/1917 synthase
MLNRGYAYSTIISSKYHGPTLLSHLASLYPHSTPQAWQQKLNNGEVTLNGVTATGSESVTLGQTLVWNRPPWIIVVRPKVTSGLILHSGRECLGRFTYLPFPGSL